MKEKVEKWQPKRAIRNSNQEMIGVEFESGRKLMISHWDHKVIGTFCHVLIKVPVNNGKNFLKKIKSPVCLNKEGQIIKIPTYWRYGIKVGGQLVTRTFRNCSEDNIPFGKWVKARAEITRAINSKTGEEKIIVNFMIGKENEKKKLAIIKFGGKEKGKTIFSTPIPGTKEKIIVNQI